jgi:hypothetical protein
LEVGTVRNVRVWYCVGWEGENERKT